MAGVIAYFKTPLTDLTGHYLTHQHFGRCKNIEMKLLNCMEAYGRDRGITKCRDFLSDFEECYRQTKQKARVEAMRNERSKLGIYEAPPREDVYFECN